MSRKYGVWSVRGWCLFDNGEESSSLSEAMALETKLRNLNPGVDYSAEVYPG